MIKLKFLFDSTMSLDCLFKSPYLEAAVYAWGMLLVTFGVGLMIAISDSRQFSAELWYTLIILAIVFMLVGFAGVALSWKIPTYRNVAPDFTIEVQDSNSTSIVEMLDDVTSVGSEDSSVVELYDASSAQRSAEVVKNCMMFQDQLQQRSLGSFGLFKETYI